MSRGFGAPNGSKAAQTWYHGSAGNSMARILPTCKTLRPSEGKKGKKKDKKKKEKSLVQLDQNKIVISVV